MLIKKDIPLLYIYIIGGCVVKLTGNIVSCND